MRRRPMILTLIALLATVGFIAPQVAQSAPANDPRAERERVRAERARVASQIDTSKASISEIDAALKALSDNLNTQEAALAKAEADVAQAEKDIKDAEAAIERLTGEIEVLRTQMRKRAIQAFVNPASEDIMSVLTTDDLNVASNRSFYIELRSQDDADIADRLMGANVDLDHEKAKATDARKRADEQRAEQKRRTETVRQARADQAQLYANAEATMQEQIARSVALAATDQKLSKQIAEQQAALAARLAEERAKAAEAARAAEAAKKAEQTSRPATSPARPTNPTTTPSTPSNPSPTTPPTTPTDPTPLPPVDTGGGGTVGGISLCTVGGIRVNCAIQTQLANLLNAARAQGLNLTGGGFRDSSSQIALRKAHCGTSYYAIYQMPSSQCRPPTAPPGRSQHEIGLAIDFNNCSSRSTACYQWLAANAARFGFYNLPSEPWHWSTTGN